MKHYIQTTFKTSDGVNLSYLRAGNGLPVILLHGFLESGACFKSQAQILAEQYWLSKDLFELVNSTSSWKPIHAGSKRRPLKKSRLAMLETLIAAIMLASLILYAPMGGADYGVECGIYLPARASSQAG